MNPRETEGTVASPSARRTVAMRTSGADATRDLGRRMAATLRAGDLVLLHGDLGSGKTTLTQGIAAGLGVSSPVQSPTFVLAHEHAGRDANGAPLILHHLDLYRLAGGDDAAAMGYAGYLEAVDAVTVVEWPERAGGLLPDAFLLVELMPGPADERLISISVVGDETDASRWLAPFVGSPTPINDPTPRQNRRER